MHTYFPLYISLKIKSTARNFMPFAGIEANKEKVSNNISNKGRSYR